MRAPRLVRVFNYPGRAREPQTSQMDRRFLFLNAGLCFWSLALAAWVYGAFGWAMALACLTLMAFTLHPIQQQVFIMFRKMKPTQQPPENRVVTAPSLPEKEPAREEKQSNTVIAADVRFDGNIAATGQVYIYGAVYGNIEAGSGIVKVMRSGLVEGNITSRELIVDGAVNGQCRVENLDIHENGRINGAIAYAALSVKKGGVLVGQSESWIPAESKTNIIDFSAEQPVDAEMPAKETVMAREKSIKGKKQP